MALGLVSAPRARISGRSKQDSVIVATWGRVEPGDPQHVLRVHADGSIEHILGGWLDPACSTWKFGPPEASPDGRAIFFVCDGEAWLHDVRTGRERQITHFTAAAPAKHDPSLRCLWSRNSRSLLIQRMTEAGWECNGYELKTTYKTTWYHVRLPSERPRWLDLPRDIVAAGPDGRWIAHDFLRRQNDLVTLDGRMKRLPRSPGTSFGEFAIPAFGRRIFAMEQTDDFGTSRIVSMTADGRELVTLTTWAPSDVTFMVLPSPSGLHAAWTVCTERAGRTLLIDGEPVLSCAWAVSPIAWIGDGALLAECYDDAYLSRTVIVAVGDARE